VRRQAVMDQVAVITVEQLVIEVCEPLATA
jgi:hypothetical protein